MAENVVERISSGARVVMVFTSFSEGFRRTVEGYITGDSTFLSCIQQYIVQSSCSLSLFSSFVRRKTALAYTLYNNTFVTNPATFFYTT